MGTKSTYTHVETETFLYGTITNTKGCKCKNRFIIIIIISVMLSAFVRIHFLLHSTSLFQFRMCYLR